MKSAEQEKLTLSMSSLVTMLAEKKKFSEKFIGEEDLQKLLATERSNAMKKGIHSCYIVTHNR